MDITILEGQALKEFYARLGVAVPSDVYSVRISPAANGIKIKVNQGIWSYAFGQKDD